MKNFIGEGNETQDEILDLLHANADETEEMDYTRKFSADELLDMKEQHSIKAVKLRSLENKKKDVMTEFKAEIDPIKKDVDNLLNNITHKAERIKGTVFKFIDHKEGRVGYYSPQGELVTERPIMQEERQLSVTSNIRDIKNAM